MIKAIDIARAVEKFAPLNTQEKWDNSGFSVGDPRATVHKILIALDCTLDVVEEAVAQKCDMILTHHPLIFGECKNVLVSENFPTDGARADLLQGRAVATAIRNNITIYSNHTPLDKAHGGLNDLMAKRLALQGCKMLSADGFGSVGNLKREMTGEEFIKYVKKQFNLKHLRCSKPVAVIKKVAVSSGAGQGSVKDSIAAGAQALVTADVSHHNFYQPNGFMILDIGHYESEWEAVALLESIVKKNFSKFAVSLSKRDVSPIFYH